MGVACDDWKLEDEIERGIVHFIWSGETFRFCFFSFVERDFSLMYK